MQPSFEQLAAWTALGHHLADVARPETLSRFRDTAEAVIDKHGEGRGSAHYDPVTEADRGAERAIRAVIEQQWPELGLLGEEYGVLRPNARDRWILDPIDGTRSFVCGLPTWTTLLGLTRDDIPVLGVVDQPFVGERWHGSSEGAFWSRRPYRGLPEAPIPIRCRPCERIQDARIATTDPRAGVCFDDAEAAGFDALSKMARVARFGADAYGYILVANGGLDLVVEAGLHPYDIAALIPIITAAGGVVTDWRGEPITFGGGWDGRVVAASDPRVHHAAIDHIATW